VAQQFVRLESRDLGDAALCDPGDAAQQPKVGVDNPLDPGTTDLDDNVPAVEQRCCMDLSDRAGRNRFVFKRGEIAFHSSADRLFDKWSHGGERQRRNPVLKFRKRIDPIGLQQITSHCKNLPELDRRRTDILQQRNDCFWSSAIKWFLTTQSET